MTKRTPDDINMRTIMKGIMKDIQKDFHDPRFWEQDNIEVEGLVMGLYEFKENAQELGFQVGIS